MAVKRTISFTDRNLLYNYIGESIKLTSIRLDSVNDFLSDLLVSVPLMLKDGDEYKFIHKTILEYFAAEYIVYHPDSKTKLNLISKSSSFVYFEKIMDFVFDINKQLFDKVVTKGVAERMNGVIKSDEDILRNIILTMNELFLCQIAVFEKGFLEEKVFKNNAEQFDLENDVEKGRDYIRYMHSSVPFEDSVGYTSSCNQVDVDGVEFFVIFAWTERKDLNLHMRSFVELSNAINIKELVNKIRLNACKTLADDFKTIYLNEWHSLNKEEHLSLMLNSDLVETVLINTCGPRKLNEALRETDVLLYYFSHKKIVDFLHELNDGACLEQEIDSLLE